MKRYTMTRLAMSASLGALLLGAPTRADAQQDDWIFSLSWGAGLPTSDTKNFTDDFSFRNVGAEFTKLMSDNFAVGFAGAWSVFNDELPNATATFPGLTVNGTQTRTVNAVPLLLTGRYFFGSSTRRWGTGSPRLWIGAGAGTVYAENRVDVGQFAINSSNWHLAVAPEAGIAVPFGYELALFGQVRYTYAFEAGGTEHRFWNFNLGVAWAR